MATSIPKGLVSLDITGEYTGRDLIEAAVGFANSGVLPGTQFKKRLTDTGNVSCGRCRGRVYIDGQGFESFDYAPSPLSYKVLLLRDGKPYAQVFAGEPTVQGISFDVLYSTVHIGSPSCGGSDTTDCQELHAIKEWFEAELGKKKPADDA